MYYFRSAIMAVIIVMGGNALVRADDPPAKAFIPLPAPHKNVYGSSASLPHFIPLHMRPIGKFIPQTSNAAVPEEMPAAHDGKPEAMTQEQASQIILLFGGGE